MDAGPLQETDAWLDRFRHFWTPHLDALATELARGKRERRLARAEQRHAADRDCRTRDLGCGPQPDRRQQWTASRREIR